MSATSERSGVTETEQLVPKKGATSVIWSWFGYKSADEEQTTLLCKDSKQMDSYDLAVPEVQVTQPPERVGGGGKWVRAFLRFGQPCLAELLGSTLFIFTGCLSVMENTEGTGRLQPALAHGLALAIVIAVLGEISGGHFNPAVSVSVFMIGGLNIYLLLPYILAQLCGGMIGAGLAMTISSVENFDNSSGAAFNVVLGDGQIGRATVAEGVMTLFLTMVVCMGAVNKRTHSLLAPLCIGLTVTVDILAGGAISGACMNPARAFGPAVMANYWSYHWIYWIGPMGGALLTGSIIRLLLGDETIRVLLK